MRNVKQYVRDFDSFILHLQQEFIRGIGSFSMTAHSSSPDNRHRFDRFRFNIR